MSDNLKDLREFEAVLRVFTLPKIMYGVYFLIYRNEVVYVGGSTNVIRRVIAHIEDQTKTFDSFSVFEVLPNEDRRFLDITEAYFIMKLKPKYNYDNSRRLCLMPLTRDCIDKAKKLLGDEQCTGT